MDAMLATVILLMVVVVVLAMVFVVYSLESLGVHAMILTAGLKSNDDPNAIDRT